MKFWIVDAFSELPFAGNPAAVFLVHDFPNDTHMQNIAMEINLSETAFVKRLSAHHYHIRWFTPNSEAPLCGHATIAAMHTLVKSGLEEIGTLVRFQSLSGELTAQKIQSYITINFPRYEVVPREFTEELRSIVAIEPIYVGFAQNCFFMEFANCRELLEINPNLQLLSALDCRALIATAKGDHKFQEYDFVSRYFAPRVGINEDPVCASAHCRLIPYWSKKLEKDSLLAYQASKRGGKIICQDLKDRVLISGSAVTVIRGELC